MGVYRRLLPATQHFLILIYGSLSNYSLYTHPPTNPYSLLEEVCMSYEHSIEFAGLAKRALELLGQQEKDEIQGCRYTCLARDGQGGEDYRARLFDKLTEITSSRENISRYLRTISLDSS